MRWLVLVVLACLPGWAAAATLRELLQMALAAADTPVTQILEGPQVDHLRRGVAGRQLTGTAWRIASLEQAGCGRYAVTLRAGDIELGTVSLDICQDGLPPDPVVVPGAK